MRRLALFLLALALPALAGCAENSGSQAPAAPQVASDHLGETDLVLVRNAFALSGPPDARVRAYTGATCPNATWDGHTLTLLQGVRAPPAHGVLMRMFERASMQDPRLVVETDVATLEGPAVELTFFDRRTEDIGVGSLFRSHGPQLFRLRAAPEGVLLVEEGAPVEGRNATEGGGDHLLQPGDSFFANATYTVPTPEGDLRVEESVELVRVGRVPVRVAPPEGPCFDVDRCGGGAEPTSTQSWRARIVGDGAWRVLLPAPVVPARAEIFPGEHEGGTMLEDWLANARVEDGEARVGLERVANGSGLLVEGRGEAVVVSSVASGMRRATCTAETYLGAVWSLEEAGSTDAVPARSDTAVGVELQYEAISNACGRHASYRGEWTAPGWGSMTGTDQSICS